MYGHTIEILHRVLKLMSAIIAIVSSATFLIASAVLYKQMYVQF